VTLTPRLDVDPADGLRQIRFAFAPVLEDPGHSADEQRYFSKRTRFELTRHLRHRIRRAARSRAGYRP
jgi:hypothetical protein